MLEEYLELKYNNLISAINQTRYMDNTIKEKRKISVRIDNKTILLVSPKKAKELKRMR